MDTRGIEAAGPARVFLALWPGRGVRDALADWSDRWHWNAEARRVRAERLHLTLHFIGDVARAGLPALRQALRLPRSPFSLSLARAAVWRGGIAVVEAERVPPPLHELHGALGAALRQLALPTDARPLRPHVTLARRAGPAVPPAPDPTLRWPVRGYVLVESIARGAGAYEIIERYP
jgi:RNA 2',3'-cyclic 3'-phosphodiesterase